MNAIVLAKRLEDLERESGEVKNRLKDSMINAPKGNLPVEEMIDHLYDMQTITSKMIAALSEYEPT